MKRLFDIVVSLLGLICFFPLLLLVAILIKLDSRGSVFFSQQRVGMRFRPFQIFNFRTMMEDLSTKGRSITVGDDPRITRVGRFLRKSKLDELPQLFNVLKGDMSLVGPRPEVPEFVNLFRCEYEEILAVRPGITDLASLQYCDEASLLGQSETPEDEYIRRVLPDKIKLAKEYIQRSSLLFDLSVICRTVFKIFDFRLSL
jgi:lipopolysaccharide/colanic/teichoic acid biosynthesis glycosyltransferase